MANLHTVSPTVAAVARESDGLGIAVARAVDLVLLALVVLPPAVALENARLDPSLPFSMLVWICAAGLLFGLILAVSDLPDTLLHPFALLAGVVGVVYVVSGVVPNLPADVTLAERVGFLVDQVLSWLKVVQDGGQATNNLLFLLLLGNVAWIIGYFSAWAVFRERSAWWPVTVSATALTVVLANFPNLFLYMVVQLTAAMLLVGRVNLEARQLRWTIKGIRQPGGLVRRAFRASLLLALALVALTWVAPTLLAAPALSQRLGHADRPWEAAQNEFNRLFGGLQGPDQNSLSGFSRSLTLHGSFHLADTAVLKIAAAKPAYWRAVVFDQYTTHGWLSTDPVDQRRISGGSDALRPSDQQRVDFTQQVTILAARGSYLVGANEPTLFDRTILAQAYPAAPGSAVDLVSALSPDPLTDGSQYTVVSKVSVASANQLRTAGRAYPKEVAQRYLPLPATVPGRVRQLATDLTSTATNPYDKAVAVETYLRTLPYSLDIPAPPPDRDGVDYFLFDVGTGYCDYFASAMAVMLRSVGVPARVVSGYATGDPQGDGTFLVKDSDSHTWPEVYFPGYGWIPFEPSGSWPHVERGNGSQAAATPTAVPVPPPVSGQSQAQATPTPTPAPNEAQPPALQSEKRLDLRPLVPFLEVLAGLALLALLIWYLWERDLRGLPPTVVAYVKMTRLAAILGFGMRRPETPDEYGHALARAVPEAGSSPSRIAADYATYRFGHKTPEVGDRPIQSWRLVRNALLWRIGRLRRR